MGTRRMFSRRITDSAKFLKMGGGAQLLYFHLCMHADDDGVVEAFTVKRGIGANDDDMQNLIGRGFIRMLDADNEIVLISDWYEHNKIRRDRITPSMYRGLIASSAPDVMLLEPTQRKDRQKPLIEVTPGQDDDCQADDSESASSGQPWDSDGTSQGQPDVNHGTTECPPKISKDKLSKDKTSKERDNGSDEPTNRKRFSPPSILDIQVYCNEKGYRHVDAEYFWNYYENVNWYVGKHKMKSWKLAVANWEKRQKEFLSAKGQVSSTQEIIPSTDTREWPF